MRGWKARVCAVAAGIAVGISGLTTVPATADDTAMAPIERFAACVAGGGQGNVLMLMDTSGSLADTDPEAGRVKAATATVNRLATSLAEVPSAAVDIAVAGFGTGYQRSLNWTPLKPDSVGTVNADIERYRGLNRSVDTDYWSAMDGVRREFTDRAKGQEAQCNLLLWFSDGEFAINKRRSDSDMQRWGGPKPWVPDNALRSEADVTAAVKAGGQDLCRTGGLADQLRSLDIITIGIGLAVDVKPEGFNLMRGISTGEACGANTTPQPGEFLMASDIDDLIYSFVTAIEQGKGEQTPACVQTQCPEGTRTFVLDGSIGAVSATAQAPIDGTRIFLKTRAGDSVELKQGKGDQDLGGARLAWEWITPRVVTLDLTRENPDNWAGPWGIVFVADRKSDELARSSITLKGDITPVLTNRDELQLRAGDGRAQLKVGVVDRTGARIDPTTLSQETTLGVALRSGSTTTPLASALVREGIEQPIDLDLDRLRPGTAELILTLDVTTQSWTEGATTIPGTKLEPRFAAIPLTILPPANYPSIPARISFGSTEKADPVTVEVPIDGEGCAWLAGTTTFTGYPDGQDGAKLSSPAQDRAGCATGKLSLTLDPAGLGNGSFTGTTKVMLAATDTSAEPISVDLAFDLSQSRPASQPVLWATLVAVTLLGVAIPVGLLYLVKYLTAKIPGTAVLGASASGPVSDGGAFTDNGVPIGVADLALTHLTGNRRDVSVAGRGLRARMGASPTEPGYVMVATAGASAGGRMPLQSRGGHAKLPLAVQGTWMVELDPQRPVSGPVTVTVFTGPGAPGFQELLADVRSGIRSEVARLREGMPAEPGAQSGDAWGAAPSGAPGADPWSSPASNPGGARPADPWAQPGGRPAAPAVDPWGNRPANPSSAPPPPRQSGPQPPHDPWANPPGGPAPGGPSSW